MRPGLVTLFARPEGRISRASFWVGLLVLLAAKLAVRSALGLPMLTTPAEAFSVRLWSFLIDAALIYPGAVLLVKRLHDRNLSGYLIGCLIAPHVVLMITNVLGVSGDLAHMGIAETIMVLITAVVSLWFLIELGFRPGSAGPNRYGAEPRLAATGAPHRQESIHQTESKRGVLVERRAQRGTSETAVKEIDEAMMARCIELSAIGATAGEVPIGSLVARDGKIVSEATNEVIRELDESRHAEIIAIARARKLIGDDELRNCTVYCTLEPCPMCSFCIRAAGVRRVVFALASPRLGGFSRWNILEDAACTMLFGPVPELVLGVLADEALKVWTDFHPVTGRATWLCGFLRKPAGGQPAILRRGGRFRHSLRPLISMFLRQQQKRTTSIEDTLGAPSPVVRADNSRRQQAGSEP